MSEPFAMIPDSVWKVLRGMNRRAYATYIAHSLTGDHKEWKQGDQLPCKLNQEELAPVAGISSRSVRDGERDLSRAGLMVVEGHKKALITEMKTGSRLPVSTERKPEEVRPKTGRSASENRKKCVTYPIIPRRERERENTRARSRARKPTRNEDSRTPEKVVCDLYNEVVAPRTTLRPVKVGSLVILTMDMVRNHWDRHEGDQDLFRRVFRAWVRAERLWAMAGVTFHKLWMAHAKGGGVSWFDGLEQGGYSDEWWTEPFKGEPLPSFAELVSGGKCQTLRYGVDFTDGTDPGTLNGGYYYRAMERKAPHLLEQYRDQIRNGIREATERGVDLREARDYYASARWEPQRVHHLQLLPLVQEEFGV